MIYLNDVVIHLKDVFTSVARNWWMDLANTALGAAIGSAATIGAVYLTFRKDRKKDDAKKEQFQIEKIKYLQSLVRITITKLKTQVGSFEELHTQITANPLNITILTTQTFYELERLVHKINQEEYYHAYLSQFNDSNESITEFRKLYVLLDYFEGNLKLINGSVEKAIIYDYERKVEFKDSVEKAQDMVTSMLINPSLAENKDLIAFIDATLTEYFGEMKDPSDLEVLYTGFIHKTKEGLMKLGKGIPEVHNALMELKKSTHIYTDIKSQNSDVAKDFKDWHKAMDDNLKILETISARLLVYKIN